MVVAAFGAVVDFPLADVHDRHGGEFDGQIRTLTDAASFFERSTPR